MDRESRISRRLFLRATALTGAGAAITGGLSPFRELDAAVPTPPVSSAGSQQSSALPPASLNEWIEHIFSSREFLGERFGPARWDEGGKSFTILERSLDDGETQELARYETATGARTVLFSSADLIPSGAKVPLPVDDFQWSQDREKLLIYTNSARVWRENTRGDYWVLDRQSKKLRKLGGDVAPSTLMFAKFSSDGSRVAYVRANNIYVEEVASGKIKQLTPDGNETVINGTSDWVYEEEFDVRDGFRWSPDGRTIAFFQFDSSPVREFSMINNLGAGFRDPVTQIPYPEFGVYPKVWTYRIPSAGTPNSNVRIGIVDIDKGNTKWLNVVGDSEKSYLPRMDWTGNGNDILLQHINRRQNQDDLYLTDGHSGHTRQILREEDAAWVDVNEDTRWLAKYNGFLWVSERDGWRHVYIVARDGSGARLVTRGNFDVIEVLAADPAQDFLYFIASPDNATQHFLFRTRMDGSAAPERLTPASMPGVHHYDISPDCQWAFHSYSSFDVPPITELISLPDHRAVRVMAGNAALLEKIKVLVKQPVEFFQVDIGEGVTLDAWMIKPADFDPSRKYPILFNVYGEPAAQTVLDAWHGAGSLYHRAIANHGYLIASVDNRGTPAPKGRAWRKIIYGAVGVLSSKEQAAAVRAIAKDRSYVDMDRVGVWGWSGGGTNTLNLMFRSPEIYRVGMSVAPVPDQRIYDTIYQERYMGLPQENVDGYRAGSAINFAEGLQGRLLLVHGTGDDNVHYAGSQLLVDRMIELGKSFDFMTYPNRTHGISEGAGTTVHIFKLLARHLIAHLPAGPAPRTMTLFLNEKAKQVSRG
ncbi:MAG TPA: S9 family peptidase [Candidatus Acidoferrales bacterium]|nr:S9 family peptidase [Candidatus Acidoferrales bacterium]